VGVENLCTSTAHDKVGPCNGVAEDGLGVEGGQRGTGNGAHNVPQAMTVYTDLRKGSEKLENRRRGGENDRRRRLC